MTKTEFLEKLNEELEFETPLELQSNIHEHEEWDSMGSMILIGFISNNFGMTLNADDLSKITTVDSLIEKIGKDKFEA